MCGRGGMGRENSVISEYIFEEIIGVMRKAIVTAAMMLATAVMAAAGAFRNEGSEWRWIYSLNDEQAEAYARTKGRDGGKEVLREAVLGAAVDSVRTGEGCEERLRWRMEVLPRGNYLVVWTEGSTLTGEMRTNGGLHMFVAGCEKGRMELVLTDAEGRRVTGAEVTAGGRRAKEREGGVYVARTGRQTEKGAATECVRVRYEGHNVYFTVGVNRYGRVWRGEARAEKGDVYGKSFVTTDKPEYKPGERLRWKAYVVDRKGRAVTERMKVSMGGYVRGGVYKEMSLGEAEAVTEGVYTGETVLADSLNLREGATYTLFLTDGKGRRSPAAQWRYKDYKLTGVRMTVEADDVQYRGRDLRLRVSAVDENGERLPYGAIKVTAQPIRVDEIFAERVVMRDVLFSREAELAAEGETEIALPGAEMPAANMLYACRVVLTDAEMNSHEQTVYVTYYHSREEVRIESAGSGNVTVEYMRDGERERRDVEVYGMTADGTQRLIYKGKTGGKVHVPQVYSRIYAVCGETRSETTPNLYGSAVCSAEIEADTVKVKIEGEDGGAFNYMIYCGKELVAEGCDTAFAMTERVRRREDYTVRVSYISDGNMYNSVTVARYDRERLYVDVEKADEVAPGDSAEVVIRVRDVSGRPVAGADITAMAVTAKFGDAWGRGVMPKAWDEGDDVWQPPFNGYAYRLSAMRTGDVDAEVMARYALGGLDYYRFMYPERAVAEHRVPTADGSAQIAPYVVKEGRIVPTAYVMIDWQPVWAGWATERQPYSFAVKEGKHTVAVRTADKMVAVKNVTVSKGEKLMLAINAEGEKTEPYEVAVQEMKIRPGEEEQRYFARYMLMPYVTDGNGGMTYIRGARGGVYRLDETESYASWVRESVRTVALFGRQGSVVYDKGLSADSMPFNGRQGYAYMFDFAARGTVMAETEEAQWPKDMRRATADVSRTTGDSVLTAEAVNAEMMRRIRAQRREIYPTYIGDTKGETAVLHCMGAGDGALNYLLVDAETDSVRAYSGALRGNFYNIRRGEYRLITLAERGGWREDTVTVGEGATYVRTDSAMRYDENARMRGYARMMDSVVAKRYDVEMSVYRRNRLIDALTGTADGTRMNETVMMKSTAGRVPAAAPAADYANNKGFGGEAELAVEEAATADMDVEAVMAEIRSAFCDVAYWYPTLRTDERGEVRVTVRYPDDLTRWNEYFVAMKGRQRGFAAKSTEARKEVTGRLYVPQFLTEGDTVEVTGGAVNYTDTAMWLVRSFIEKGREVKSAAGEVENAVFDTAAVAAAGDSVRVAYAVTDAAGNYIDGEKRSIGVQPKGMMKTDGEFHVMERSEGAYEIDGAKYGRPFELHIEGDVTELMRRDAERVLECRFETNDVLAAKLTVLLMMQTDEGLKPVERARNRQQINSIIGRLERNRNAEGLWSWYGRREESVWFVSETVYRALSKAHDMGYEVGAIRDKKYVAYALGAMETASEEVKVEAALLMAEMQMPLEARVVWQSIEIDSLSELGRLKYCQLAAYMGELCGAIDADTLAVRSMTGGLHYELRGMRPEARRVVVASDVEATLAVYKTLRMRATADAAEKCRAIRRWLLSQRRYGGYWRNYNEGIKILDVLMADMFADGGKTACTVVADGRRHEVKGLPFDTVFPAGTKVTIEKRGGGEAFVGTAMRYWVNDVTAGSYDGMSVETEWENGGDTLHAGEETELRVRLTMEKDADYVMVRVPVPAGCELKRGYYGKWFSRSYTEYYRDEACLFFEYMPKGEHEFTVRVVNRFAGAFTQNPVQAELFYFPMMGANGEMRRVVIE